MMSRVDRSVRLSQTITPFGVGAIYDVLGESFVACETSYWKRHGTPLKAQRLADKMPEVKGFRSAPSSSSFSSSASDYGVPYFRFPQWLFCGSCRRMVRWKYTMEEEGEPAVCENCRGRRKLVPMRFVAICDRGHMSDVPWVPWAHANPANHEQRQCARPALEFVSASGRGSGLASLGVRCRTCKAENNLGGLTQPGTLKRVGARCEDRQPWQSRNNSPACDEIPLVVQRGASNVWFARIESAIDIPPYSTYEAYSDKTLDIANAPEWEILLSAPNGPLAGPLKQKLSMDHGVEVAQIESLLRAEPAEGSGPALPPEVTGSTGDLETDLLEEEWLALVSPRDEFDDRDHFVAKRVGTGADADASGAGARLAGFIEDVVLVTRLREVRALSGFSRVKPGTNIVRPDLGKNLDWLPAVEVHGEGIFVAFREAALRDWESRGDVRARAAVLETRRAASFYSSILSQPAAPRRILLHTLAHLLMRQFAFESGYSSAALRERLYTHTTPDGATRAGILIYTAAGDVEGTLGGLVRLGDPPQLLETLLAALRSSAWCSADPVCGESRAQGVNGMNLAACHACGLVAETSCVQLNSLLDRGLVTGTPEDDVGFFGSVVDEAVEETLGVRR
jgi:hypothetical protein